MTVRKATAHANQSTHTLLLLLPHLARPVVCDLPSPLSAVQRVWRLLQIKLDMRLTAAGT
jgi:hypothetical protein